MKLSKIGLLPKVVIAIILGVLCSLFFPVWAVRIFVTFGSIFGSFLGMFIPLLIIGLVAPGIAELGKGAGKLLLITAGIAYVSTVLAGLFSYGICSWTYPSLLGDSLKSLSGLDMSNKIAPYFTMDIPPFMAVTTALVIAFILGLCVSVIEGNALRGVLEDFRDLVFVVIRSFIIPLLPLYIFGIFLQMGAEGSVGAVLGMFVKIILIIFAMHVTFLVVQFCIAGAISHRNPFKALVTMFPAYMTALGTQSSAATIPVTLAQTKKLGVRDDVADFTVPLCATIHMSCSILKITACAFAISLSMGLPCSFSVYAGFVCTLAITMVAAPGVPGGAIMASLGLLASMLGFDSNLQALMIALYIAMDSFGTAGNVTGDGAIAMIIDRIKGTARA